MSPHSCASRLAATLVVFFSASVPRAQAQPAPAPSSLTLVGDMVLDQRHFRSHARGPSTASPSAFAGIDDLYASPWAGGRMPIEFDASVSDSQRTLFFDVCDRWSRVADVRCVPASGGEDALTVTTGGPFSGCNSVVGYSRYYRTMNLEAACWYDSLVLHEIGHAFGLLHEHQRADRDAFIAIDYGNVQAGYAFAFNYGFGTVHGPYDLRSIMHYQWYAFAVDSSKPALRPRGIHASLLHQMGTGKAASSQAVPSDGDASALRSIYGSNSSVPGAPRNLRLDGVRGNTVSLAWDAPVTGTAVEGYRIEIGADSAFTRTVATQVVGADVTSGSGALPNGIMHVRIVPQSRAGDGVPSDTLSFQLPDGALILPPQPPLLAATQAATNPITLTWEPTGGGSATSYTVIAGTTPGLSDLGVLEMGTASSLSGNVPPDAPIYVRVIAANAAGTAVSNLLTIHVPTHPTIAAPSLHAATVDGHTVTLSWTGPAMGVAPSSYIIRARRTDEGPVVGSWTVSGTTLLAGNVPSGAYQVSVAAVAGPLVSDQSNRVWVAVP